MAALPSVADDAAVDVSARAILSGFHHCPPTWTLPRRQRGHYQLWAVLTGELDFWIDGGHRIVVGPRSLILLPPGIPQRATHRAEPLACFVTHFMVFDRGVPTLTFWPAAVIPQIAADPWAEIVDRLAVLTELNPIDARPTAAQRLVSTGAMTEVLGRIASLATPERTAASAPRALPEPIGRAMAHIRDHLDRPLSVEQLAARIGVTPGALRHQFRTSVGQSPSAFIRQHRLAVARDLLRDTTLSIASIARRTGFSDPFYFSRVFRRAEGVPPSQWREALDDGFSAAGGSAVPAATGPVPSALRPSGDHR